MAYQLYPNYKSGDYFSSLPDEWCEERLRDIAAIKTSNVDKKTDEDQEPVQLCNYVDVYYHSKINSDITFMKATASKAEIKRFKLNVGDVVITKDSEDPFDIGIPALIDEDIDDLVCGYHLSILEAFDERLIGNYLFYALESESSKHQFTLASNGVTRFGLTQQGTKNLKICVPSIQEQQKIADFLDYKTQQIDKLIEKKKALIEKLNEQRIAVITQAVTKGIDKNAKMKPSGVDWLGDVPEHWEVEKLKFSVSTVGGGTPNTSVKEYWDGDIPWVSPKDMKFEVITSTEDYITKKGLEESATSLIDEGEVLIVVRSGILQHSIPVAINDKPVSLNQDMKAIVADRKILIPEFLKEIIWSNQKSFLPLWSKPGCTVESIETDYMLNTVIALPPTDEQKNILKKIKYETTPIEKMIKACSASIGIYVEYRSSLITSAVTGKIDIRDVEIGNGENP